MSTKTENTPIIPDDRILPIQKPLYLILMGVLKQAETELPELEEEVRGILNALREAGYGEGKSDMASAFATQFFQIESNWMNHKINPMAQ